MGKNIRIFAAVFAVLIVSACANKAVQQEVDRDVFVEPTRPLHGGVAYKGLESVEKSTVLSDDQKERLTDLHGKMIEETFGIQEETSRLKGVLFDTLTKAPYNAAKVDEIKTRLIALNERKMKNMFSALEKAEVILGKVRGADRSRIYDALFFEPRNLRDDMR